MVASSFQVIPPSAEYTRSALLFQRSAATEKRVIAICWGLAGLMAMEGSPNVVAPTAASTSMTYTPGARTEGRTFLGVVGTTRGEKSGGWSLPPWTMGVDGLSAAQAGADTSTGPVARHSARAALSGPRNGIGCGRRLASPTGLLLSPGHELGTVCGGEGPDGHGARAPPTRSPVESIRSADASRMV